MLHGLFREHRVENIQPTDIAREAWGIYAVASGLREITREDFDNTRPQFPVYDALSAYCRTARA